MNLQGYKLPTLALLLGALAGALGVYYFTDRQSPAAEGGEEERQK